MQTKSVRLENIMYIMWKRTAVVFTHGRSQKGKDFRCYLGDRLDSVPCHQDERKNRMKSSYSSNRPGANHPILPIVLVQIILFFQSSGRKSSYFSNRPGKKIARNWSNSVPQAAVTTFAFSSVNTPFFFVIRLPAAEEPLLHRRHQHPAQERECEGRMRG